MPNDALLAVALDAAVPLWIERVRDLSFAERQRRAQACADTVAHKGDVILFRGKKGESAEAFNRLAEGIACLAFAPGGVEAFGRHWQADRPAPVRRALFD